MSLAVITGSAGLVGSESAKYFADVGFDIAGIDNDMRSFFFGREASTQWQRQLLQQRLGRRYLHFDLDVRDSDGVEKLFRRFGAQVRLVIHAAAQPSHDWAAGDPVTDFTVNANGTLTLLEAARQHAPDAVFIFVSTNKVYGDRPNSLPFEELESRYEILATHPYAQGIPENMPLDQSLHSLFGASKAAADLLVQEYGRYFGLKTVCFRGGCLTGPNHSGIELHGFLAYLMKCVVTGKSYSVFGYKGKQVRDNIHSLDLVRAFHAFFDAPRPGEIYNIGGGRFSNCSIREAIALCEEIADRKLEWRYVDRNRTGDHIWWISDLGKFCTHYPSWSLQYDVRAILEEIYSLNHGRWKASVADES